MNPVIHEMAKFAVDLDYLFSNPLGNITGKPPVALPSGNIIHNPAQKTVKSGDKQATKLITRAQAAATDWLAGVNSPSRDPVAAAKDANGKWKSKMQQAIQEDRFSKGLNKTSAAEIIAIANKVGAQGYSNGVGAREDKIKRVFNDLQPLQQQVSNAIQSMPQDTDAQRAARMLAARTGMIAVGAKRRGS